MRYLVYTPKFGLWYPKVFLLVCCEPLAPVKLII
jgi:hypothetical protein